MFCIYETSHPLGYHYTGKSRLDIIARGYKGSGVVLKRIMKKYPKDEWTTKVLCTFEDEEGIDLLEQMCIADAKKKDKCLNIAPGGTGGVVWAGKSPLSNPLNYAKTLASRKKNNKPKPITSEQTKAKMSMSSPYKGKPRTIEHQNAITEGLRNSTKIRPPATLERKSKVKAALLNRVFSIEHIFKIQTSKAIKYGRASPFNQVTGGL
jgi:hypothetical protein